MAGQMSGERSPASWTRRLGWLCVAPALLSACVLAPEPAARAPGHLPAERLASDRAEASLDLKRGVVVAQTSIRAAHAIIADERLSGPHGATPAGTALALVIIAGAPDDVDIPEEPQRRAWCDVTMRGALNCFSDANGDGRLEQQLSGRPRTPGAPFTMGLLVDRGPLAAPISYRTAAMAERPQTLTGYRYCGDTPPDTPPRFAAVIAGSDGTWRDGGRPCAYGVWASDQTRRRVQVDAAEIAVAPDTRATYSLITPPPPGPVFVFRAGQPVRATADVHDEIADDLAETSRPAVAPTARARLLTRDRVAPGERILAAPARHTLTGVLQNTVKPRGLFTSFGFNALDVGTPVYGVPMASPGIEGQSLTNRSVMWCAPRAETDASTDDGRPSAAPRWRAICLPQINGDHRWWPVRDGLYAQFGDDALTANDANPPSVERRALDFGAELALEAVFVRWLADAALIRLQIRADGDVYPVREVRAPLDDRGSARMALLGGRFVLDRDGDGARPLDVGVAGG